MVDETQRAPTTPIQVALEEAHQKLASDVRDVPWESTCGSEIFTKPTDGSNPMRIGHFQGDANLAAFCVSAHNLMLGKD